MAGFLPFFLLNSEAVISRWLVQAAFTFFTVFCVGYTFIFWCPTSLLWNLGPSSHYTLERMGMHWLGYVIGIDGKVER
jgi:hypothetical protein